uniref:Aminoacyl-tRNA hydrolase n=1 Tax=Steinernema glaseri TaxID=37863 RepID=A0A1I7ZDJ0_9BILA
MILRKGATRATAQHAANMLSISHLKECSKDNADEDGGHVIIAARSFELGVVAQRAHHRGGGGGGGGGGRGRGKEGPTGGETDGRKTRNITGTNNARASLSDRRAALSVRWTARRTDRHRVEDGRAHNSDGQKSAPRLTKTCRP